MLSFIHTATFSPNCTSLLSCQQFKKVLIPPDPHPHFLLWLMCMWDWNAKNFRSRLIQTHPPPHFQIHKIEAQTEWVSGSLRSKMTVRNTTTTHTITNGPLPFSVEVQTSFPHLILSEAALHFLSSFLKYKLSLHPPPR